MPDGVKCDSWMCKWCKDGKCTAQSIELKTDDNEIWCATEERKIKLVRSEGGLHQIIKIKEE